MAKNLEERVSELEKIVKELTKEKIVKMCKSLSIGDEFEIAGIKWTILDITDKGYLCLGDKLKESQQFDEESNNWQTSNLRNYLNTDFYKILSECIGEDNIISFNRDLLSLDGQTEYEACQDKVSLLTVDEYRKYRKYIQNVDYWWWLITPWSTPCNGYKSTMAVVSSSGNVYNYGCLSFIGLRPVCIFSSSIFESEE